MTPAVASLALLLAAALAAGCGGDGADTGAPRLDGVSWILTGGVDVEGWETATPSIAFDGARLGGFTGCNSYGADYTLDGSSLALGEVSMTLIGCPSPAADVERAFLAALERVAAWRIDDELVLLSADDAEPLRFEPATPVGSWHVVDSGGLENLIPGVRMTATFTEGGDVRGGAGCNTYRATYTTDGGAIEISPPAATRKHCAEPEGVMEQEAAFLAALAGAERFQVHGNSLMLTRADGIPLVSFGRRGS